MDDQIAKMLLHAPRSRKYTLTHCAASPDENEINSLVLETIFTGRVALQGLKLPPIQSLARNARWWLLHKCTNGHWNKITMTAQALYDLVFNFGTVAP